MASNISVSQNESIQNDHDYIEVDKMVLKVKNVNINKDDRAVTLAIKPNNTQKKNQEQLHTDCEDSYSKKEKFSWQLVHGYHIPYIIRVINGVKLQFVSVRMVETLLLGEYLQYLHENMYTCTSVRSYFITDSEAALLNDINNFHCDFAFGYAIFFARKDYIISLEDAQEFYTFIDVCYKVLLSNDNTGRKKKCGYILFNFESVLPYAIKDDKKYIPLFCFESETKNLQHLTVKLENWNLAYLKFCCKLQGIINNEFFASDSCTVISLDDIKNSYSSDTFFEEYWPPNIIDIQILTNENSTHVNPPGVWIKPPLEVVIAENSTIPQTLTESTPVLPTSMPVMMNSHQNGRPANQMGSTMLQGSSLIIGAGHVVPPPPPYESVNKTPVIGDTVSYSNAVPLSLCRTTMNNSMINSNVMSHSNQMQKLYTQNAINNSQAQQQQIQQQQFQQQQLIISTPQIQPSHSSQYVHGHLPNTQLHNTSRNVGLIVATPAIGSIDFTSQPCNPILPTVQDTSLRPRVGWELTRIPERLWTNGTNIAAYKIRKVTLEGRIIHCINANPYMYSDVLIMLRDLVQAVLPSSWTVTNCAQHLQKYSKITLFGGNSEQLALLWRCGLISSIDPEHTPMAMLQDIRYWLNTIRLNYRTQNAPAPPNM
ncbi:uncharacterized protein LOC132938363 isoform X2 [Metopolophium dirhodum]|uniref:uncharacterized protein LOC132938363 isoform X2 n=1 Tax=Metopolophium dirhodum TaxID=44670 RepID=UPI00298F5CF2|nr:uncharacterized protein LOC132938363 isoform X2 [Metopolophium dirhodum]